MPGLTVKAEIVQKARIKKRGHRGAMHQVVGLPGVQWQQCSALGMRGVAGEACHEPVGGQRTTALGPGGILCQHGPVNGAPAQGKEPRNSGEYIRLSASERPSRLFGVGCRG